MGSLKLNSSDLKKTNNVTKVGIMKQINDYVEDIYEGSLTIVKQDGHIVQFNLSEKYNFGDYLC
ncbi:DUF2292 domain-containing protein [Clostridium cylindrosporum]|uniref:DUF2292 domain-containing protein n=1 Tax=Clostridium cylindrosporum DSM 605 TaxID=1121307 RepID=A0A0J8D9G0_CLOCY|nr:DUF2292 domain-containing protein [Clostridium cylindrosporum]KMT20959.1 hypothetical protein CLCY_1c01930 [Clostridium cylindrosporum DSM 605]